MKKDFPTKIDSNQDRWGKDGALTKRGLHQFFSENTHYSGENNFFCIILTKIFTTQKILKMENKHPEHFWSA